MGALDLASQPVDRTMRVRVNAYQDAEAADLLKRQQQEEALRIAQAQEERAQQEEQRRQAEEARKVTEEAQKTQLPIATNDVVEWQLAHPSYGVPFAKAPEEAKQHFIQARTYDPAVAAKIPEIWNQTLPQTTGSIPGLDDWKPTGATRDVASGKTSLTLKPPVNPEAVGELTDNQKTLAESIARYDIPPMQALGRFNQADREKIMAYAANLGYDAKEYPVRLASRKDFTSGQAARSITSLNTLIHHFDRVMDSAKKLSTTGMPAVNTPLNYLRKNVGGNPDITAFDTNASAVAEEMAKLLKGGIATKSEIDDWKAKLDRNLAPDQLSGNIKEMMQLMAGRVDALRNQWQSAYDKPRDLPFIDEDAQRILQKHGFNPAEIDPLAKPTVKGAPTTTPPAGQPAGIQPPIRMTSPEGAVYMIPVANVEAAKARGFK